MWRRGASTIKKVGWGLYLVVSHKKCDATHTKTSDIYAVIKCWLRAILSRFVYKNKRWIDCCLVICLCDLVRVSGSCFWLSDTGSIFVYILESINHHFRVYFYLTMRKYINKMSALEMTTNKKKSFSVQGNLTLAQPKSINKISAFAVIS